MIDADGSQTHIYSYTLCLNKVLHRCTNCQIPIVAWKYLIEYAT